MSTSRSVSIRSDIGVSGTCPRGPVAMPRSCPTTRAAAAPPGGRHRTDQSAPT
ncbi:hypothetical protein [Modestobacter italicus]|uniref:hypothetical protein n=1 Tax=Modestobacter italicus (strain DSM 44449 / CECT 9708 / BC 501) TaxID=2732864 RepID=UPI001C95B1C6|nr:hypothetical protein [Modestobacter italicus]